ncbi:MAG: hypothetical protein J6M60_05165 [Clostridia bacterium]|nr:hypothetical protein [Clostridia bacterium]
MENKRILRLKSKIYILIIVTFLGCALFVLSGCSSIKYETDRDKIIQSPDNSYSITIRYDYVSRPDIYKDGKIIFKYDGSGFMENVDWDVEWLSEKDILLYIKSPQKEKYNKEKYYITIN